mmetsp:Transcript_74478/g.112223  ORF Transcript_74478/g.112223 Transcript_74478/m.112223 type:complete len:251 (+) Transcript_74478:39-791(+)
METFDSKLWMLRQKFDEVARYPHLAENALRDLYQELVSSSGEMLDHEGKMLVHSLANEGAIKSIVEVMLRPCVTPTLVYRALGVLTLFAQEEARIVESEGGFHAIVSALRNFPDADFVQEAAIVALVECGRSSEQYRSNVQEVLGIIAQTMEAHKHSPRIFYLSCTAIRIASQSGIMLDDNLANRIYGNLLDGIILFPGDEIVQNAGREVLSLWVGFENALDMIQLRASALVAMADILHQASGIRRPIQN